MGHGRRTAALSARIDSGVLARLKECSARTEQSAARLAERLIDEGLRMEEFPGIVFRPGPSGRRAGLFGGPDIWEIIADLQRAARAGSDPVGTVMRNASLREDQVRLAAAYYDAYPKAIDSRIRLNEELSERALRTPRSGFVS